MRERRYLVFLPIAALLAVLPLIVRGNSCGHDFEFHMFNWLEVGSQWKQGVLLPHWEFTAAGNSGEPRFVFYPPLSWAIGALLGLILPWAAVPATFLWLALTACGCTMYRLAREWSDEGVALFAAGVYIVHPYMLFTYYERSAYAELLAAAWFPLVLLALLRRRITMLGIAIPIALLWLTNDPAAVMGSYTLALLTLLRIGLKFRSPGGIGQAAREAATAAGGTCLGMALAGFYLVPAIVEQRWVQIRMVSTPGVRVQDNFLFGQIGGLSHRAILRTVSLCSVSLLILVGVSTLVALLSDFRRRTNDDSEYRRLAIASLSLLAVVIGFLLTSPSASLWRYAPELIFLQFPWRFDAVLGCVAAALLALALSRMKLRFSLALAITLAGVLCLSLEGERLFRQYCNRGNDVASLVTDFHSGRVYDLTDEYTPAGDEPSEIGHNNPSAWTAAVPSGPAPESIPRNYSVELKDRLHFEVSSSVPAYLVINLRDYPAWKIAVNGIAVVSRPHRIDGLIALPISQGVSKIDISYALTSDRIAGWLITAFAVGAAFIASGRRKIRLPFITRR